MTRDELILSGLPLVRKVARNLKLRTRCEADLEDLIGDGTLGLIHAADTFDPSREVKFLSYAYSLILHRMYETVEQNDWATTGFRSKWRRLAEATARFQARCYRDPHDAELAQEAGITEEELRELRMDLETLTLVDPISLDDEGIECNLIEAVPSPAPSQYERVKDILDNEQLQEGLAALRPRWRQVMHLYYVDDMTFQEIGDGMGFSNARASAIHACAVGELRHQFRRKLRIPN